MTYDWHTEYARALSLFGGDTPSAHLEQEILDAFTTSPAAVANAITKIGKAYEAGKIHSPWGALKAEIPKQLDHHVKADGRSERARQLARAEQWTRNAGLHYPTFEEALEDIPAHHEDDTGRLLELWTQLRPAGIQTDTDQDERLAGWKARQDELPAAPTRHRTLEDLRDLARLKAQQPLPNDYTPAA